MKKHLYLLAVPAILALALNSCGPTYVVHQDPQPAYVPPPPPPPPPQQDPPPVTDQSFYDQLSPYGQWLDNPTYGYVWMPDVGPDFKPYTTNGHWVYTDEGWTWASDYPWGWAAFHYGRWFFQDGYGWMWIPGHEWAPAWVSWRRSPDYYGWAPLGPSISIEVSTGGYNPPAHYWSFVPHQYVTSPQVNNYRVNETKNVTIINNTTVINNTVINNNVTNNNIRNTNITNNNVTNNNTTNNVTNNVTNNRINNTTINNYAGGPDPSEVSRVTGTTVRPIPIRQTSTPGEQVSNGSLSIYRPRVNTAPQSAGGSGAARPAPSRIQSINNVRPVNPTVYSTSNTAQPGITTQPATRINTGFHQPPAQQVNQNQPFNRPVTQPAPQQPVNQPPVNQRPVNQPGVQPAVQPGSNAPGRPYNQPSPAPVNQNPAAVQPGNGRPYDRPVTQPVNQPPVNQPPVNRQPVNQQAVRPGNQPAMQPGGQQPYNRPVTLPVRQQPINQPAFNNRPATTQPVQPAGARPNPAANPPRPAPRPVSPPPPARRDTAGRDSRRQ